MNLDRLFWTAVMLAPMVVACGSSDSGGGGASPVYDAGPVDNSVATEQLAGACDTSASKGTVTAGGTCLVATDCKPVCCKCTTGTKAWTAAVCNGTCADSAAACDATKNDAKFCN